MVGTSLYTLGYTTRLGVLANSETGKEGRSGDYWPTGIPTVVHPGYTLWYTLGIPTLVHPMYTYGTPWYTHPGTPYGTPWYTHPGICLP